MQLNPIFLTNIRHLHADEGIAWLQQLSAQIAQLETQWNIRFISPLPELSYNFVGIAERLATTERVILKIAPPAHHLSREIAWLNQFNSIAPLVYAHTENAILMEYLQPGHSLKKQVQDDDTATHIICAMIRKSQQSTFIAHGFPHLSTLPAALVHLENHFDAKLLAQAKSLFQELTSTHQDDRLLHGDLHHDNILQDGAAWKTIDPHGYIGDAAAEVGTMIRNPLDKLRNDAKLPKIIERRLHIIKNELPFDPQKIKAWAFCMTVLSAAWNREDHHGNTEFEAAVATAINKIKI